MSEQVEDMDIYLLLSTHIDTSQGLQLIIITECRFVVQYNTHGFDALLHDYRKRCPIIQA